MTVFVGGLYAIARSKARAVEGAQRIVVADIEMPFWSMVVFMVKWAIAGIPAMLILIVIATLVFLAFAGVLAGAVVALLR